MSAAPWDQPGYEPLTLSELRKARDASPAPVRATPSISQQMNSIRTNSPLKKSRPVSSAAPLRKARPQAARPTSHVRPRRAATPSPGVVIKVRQEEPAVIEALGNLTRAVAVLAARKQSAPVVNVHVPARKLKTTTHRDAEGFITHTVTEPID